MEVDENLTRANLPPEPGAGIRPEAVGGPGRHAEDAGGLENRKPREVAELDQLGGCGVGLGQAVQGFIVTAAAYSAKPSPNFARYAASFVRVSSSPSFSACAISCSTSLHSARSCLRRKATGSDASSRLCLASRARR
jgi:hypothetical protein